MEASSRPRGVDHIGLTVPDIDEAAAFLERAFGAVALYDVQPPGDPPMSGPAVETQLGLPPGGEIVHMRLMRIGEGPSLELFAFAGTAQAPPAALPDFGLQHFALYVDDIEAAAARFEQAGGHLLSPPHSLAGVEAGPRNAGVYGQPPWGGLIELISYPDGLDVPGGQAAPRWTPDAPQETHR